MKYDIYKTTNRNTIKKIIMQDDIAENLLDNCKKELIDEFNVNIHRIMDRNLVIYIMRKYGIPVGIAFFTRQKDGSVKVDEAFSKNVRGKCAKELANLTLSAYIDEYKPCTLKGDILRKNKRALVFAKWLGFQVESSDEHKFYVVKKIKEEAWA